MSVGRSVCLWGNAFVRRSTRRTLLAYLALFNSDYIASLKFGGTNTKNLSVTTHKVPLCAAIYNAYYKQVVTGADDASIVVWDIESGMKCIAFQTCK